MRDFIEDITQSVLDARAGANNLLPGQKYRVTDSGNIIVECETVSTYVNITEVYNEAHPHNTDEALNLTGIYEVSASELAHLLGRDVVTITSTPYNVLNQNIARVHEISSGASAIVLPSSGNVGDEIVFVDTVSGSYTFTIDGNTNIYTQGEVTTSFVTPNVFNYEWFIFKYIGNNEWEIVDALDKKYVYSSSLDSITPLIHTQNTDTVLDSGGLYEVSASEIVGSMHTQNTDTVLDSGGTYEVSASDILNHMQSQAILKSQVFS